MKSIVHVCVALCVATGSLGAQVLETKTIELRHLKPIEAVKLLSPYVRSTGGGVFEVSEKIPIVTVRDTPDNIAAMERVLAKYDHSPATIRLVFQLIEADTGNRMTPAGSSRNAVAIDLDSTLRSVLKFPSYRLLTQGVATAGEFSHVGQLLANAEMGATYNLRASIGTIRLTETGAGTVHLEVILERDGPPPPADRAGSVVGGRFTQSIISTGLDVPLGHMVVLGTAATRTTGVALILTVKPELVRVPR